MIEFSCESCGRQYNVSDDLGGRRVKCKDCQAVIAIPAPAAVAVAAQGRPPRAPAAPPPRFAPAQGLIDFTCESCGQRYQVKEELAGRRVKCKGCQEVITIPDPGAGASSALDLYGLDESAPAAPKASRGDDYGLGPAVAYNPYSAPRSDELAGRGSYGDEARSSGAPAGFLYRVGSWFLDTIIVVVLAVVAGIFLGIAIAASGVQMELPTQILLGNAIGLLVTLAYHSLLNASPGQATFGKRALGLRVVDVDGRRIGLGRAVGRELLKIVPSFLMFLFPEAARPFFGLFFILAYGITLTNPARQSLFDMLSGVYVVFRK